MCQRGRPSEPSGAAPRRYVIVPVGTDPWARIACRPKRLRGSPSTLMSPTTARAARSDQIRLLAAHSSAYGAGNNGTSAAHGPIPQTRAAGTTAAAKRAPGWGLPVERRQVTHASAINAAAYP